MEEKLLDKIVRTEVEQEESSFRILNKKIIDIYTYLGLYSKKGYYLWLYSFLKESSSIKLDLTYPDFKDKYFKLYSIKKFCELSDLSYDDEDFTNEQYLTYIVPFLTIPKGENK